MFEDLRFRYPFRKYQEMILENVEAEILSGKGDQRYHIMAPPGSGKTIVGLELIRRFLRPAVIFAPTTTIQKQWQEKVGMFTELPERVDELTSLDPDHLADINIFTYQLISTAGESRDLLKAMAVREWKDDLLREAQSRDETKADERLRVLERNNPRAYRRELSRRAVRVKKRLLKEKDVDVSHFLHPNAMALICSLVDRGIGTIVLDECHHLLDYWAIVLRHLIEQVPGVQVIGLTATLPDPEDDKAHENYSSLLGDVDFEVPTPAVVKEGDLAPYRDLAYFVEPTNRELQYLENIKAEFERAIHELTASPEFREWVLSRLTERREGSGYVNWADFIDQYPAFSIAALRFLRHIGHVMHEGMVIPLKGRKPLTIDDWVVLLERYGLDRLKVSSRKEDHELFERLRKILQPFGMTLTERGIRQSRSPGDLVLAFSESKDVAVGLILAAELGALDRDLRAVVVTDFEKMSSGVKRLEGVLNSDAGSAIRIFKFLANHPVVGDLDPILVTGRTVMADSDLKDRLLDRINGYLIDNGLNAECAFEPTDSPKVVKVVGTGSDWSSRTYVTLITTLFEEGLTRCLVGTRGIFGEGWDSLSLNTLIDLTSVTTSTSVQQLRGRSTRLDPKWPKKVANNWDVVCVARQFEKGDADLDRFTRRHDQYWGLMESVDDGGTEGEIVKGIGHIDPELAFQLHRKDHTGLDLKRLNKLMLARLSARDKSHDLWKVGSKYKDRQVSRSRMVVDRLKLHSVHTLQQNLAEIPDQFESSRRIRRQAKAYYGLLFISWLLLFFDIRFITMASMLTVGGCLLLATIKALDLRNHRNAVKVWQTRIASPRPEDMLQDIGRALLESLKRVGSVSRRLNEDYIRLEWLDEESVEVVLDYASPADSALFTRSLQELFMPLVDQRYLILYDVSRLSDLAMDRVWVQWGQRMAQDDERTTTIYYPLPKELGRRNKFARIFAESWERYVGGSELVNTRSGLGRQIMLEARAQERPEVDAMAFTTWL